jgi:hypothetical protein
LTLVGLAHGVVTEKLCFQYQKQKNGHLPAAGAFVRQFIDGDEDMTYSVRLMLDSKAAALPKSVRPCVEQQDSEVQKAMFAGKKSRP